MIACAYLILRRYGGPGSEKLAAALALFGMANVPFIYISVNYWRTIHPATIGGAEAAVPMGLPLWFCVIDVPAAVHRAAEDAGAARRAAAPAWTRSISHWTNADERRMKRCVCRVAARCSWLAAAFVVRTQPTPTPQPQQQDEFVPIDQLPPQEQMPAAPLLIARLRVRAGRCCSCMSCSVARRLTTCSGRSSGWRPTSSRADAPDADSRALPLHPRRAARGHRDRLDSRLARGGRCLRRAAAAAAEKRQVVGRRSLKRLLVPHGSRLFTH